MESDDNLNAFLEKPIEPKAQAVKNRPQNDFARALLSDFPMRKKSMQVHSSVLAMSNKSPNTVQPTSNGAAANAERIRSSPVSTIVKTNSVPKNFGKFN